MKLKGMISEAPPRSSLTEGAPQRSGEGSWAEERGGEGGGCYSSRMEIGEEEVVQNGRVSRARGRSTGFMQGRGVAGRHAGEEPADNTVDVTFYIPP